MKINFGTANDKRNYLLVQKEAFPNIDTKRDSKFFDKKIKNKEIFVMRKDNEYIGHLCFGNYKLTPPFTGSIFIEELAVKKKFRGNGYGTVLLDRVAKFCKSKNIISIYLGTEKSKSNKAIKYYEKLGFKKVGFIDDIDKDSEYDDPQVLYAIMVKDWRYNGN